jgi:hypothetical protein
MAVSWGWGYTSVVEYLPSMHKALSSFSSYAEKKKKVKRRGKVSWIKGRNHVFTQYHPSSKDL